MDSTVTSITLDDWTCNKPDCEYFDVSRFSVLESLEIGSNSFAFVRVFKIKGLQRLKYLKIGRSAFTKHKSEYGDEESDSFHILNCNQLESIEIGEYSFSDYAGEFELINLDSLQSLKIGSIKNDSFNFYGSSFVIRGISWIVC